MECPYCDKEQREPDELGKEGHIYEQECADCEKTFGVSYEMIIKFDTCQLPCANGEPHKWYHHTYWHNPFKQDQKFYTCEYCQDKKYTSENLP